jgi:hypothetical protein
MIDHLGLTREFEVIVDGSYRGWKQVLDGRNSLFRATRIGSNHVFASRLGSNE